MTSWFTKFVRFVYSVHVVLKRHVACWNQVPFIGCFWWDRVGRLILKWWIIVNNKLIQRKLIDVLHRFVSIYALWCCGYFMAILWLFYCYMGASYEVFVIVHLLNRTLIHQKAFSTINWINNLNVKIPIKSSAFEISMPLCQILAIVCLFGKIEYKKIENK